MLQGRHILADTMEAVFDCPHYRLEAKVGVGVKWASSRSSVLIRASPSQLASHSSRQIYGGLMACTGGSPSRTVGSGIELIGAFHLRQWLHIFILTSVDISLAACVS